MTGQNLRQRAQQHTNGAGDNAGGEVAKREPATVAEMIDAQRPALARALPKHLDADRLARIAITVVKQTPELGRCEPFSLLGALMTAAQLGLEPGPLGEAYLVPFENKRRGVYEATFIAGYQGLVKLFWQSPMAKHIDAQAVFEGDEFDYQYGTDPYLRHKPVQGARGKVIYYYAVAGLSTGANHFVVLTPEEVKALRQGRVGPKGDIKDPQRWMERKTGLRQLSKLLPKSAELADFHQAVARDESVRLDFGSPLEEADARVVDGEVVAETGEAPHDPDAQAQAEADAEKARAAEATS